MNDKDKEAYAIYESTIFQREGYLYIAREAWQAACEYKQKEIDELNKAVEFFTSENTHYFESLEKLQAENAKLRAVVNCLASADAEAVGATQIYINNAKRVLKELEEK